MSRRSQSSRILRTLTSLFSGQSTSRRSTKLRRIGLETLELRYALDATPVANNDLFFDQYEPVPSTVGPLLVLNNDTADLHSLLKVTEVNGAQVSVPVGATETFSLSHGTLVLRANHESFDYTPNAGYTGLETFTYKAADGPLPGDLSNLATVTIDVTPVANAGGDQGPGSYTIYEGGVDFFTGVPLVLDGSLSAGPGAVTYYWSINSQPLNPAGSSTPVLNVSWDDLNDVGILDGNVTTTVSLRVVDGNGEEAVSTVNMEVINVAPVISNLAIVPASSGCGGLDYVLTATFTDVNPLDTNFTVSVNWDALGSETTTTTTVNGTGTIALSIPYTFLAAGDKLPMLQVTANGPGGFDFLETATDFLGDESDPEYDLFVDGILTVTPGTGGSIEAGILGAPATGVEGTAIALTSDATASCDGTITSYAWEVFKDDVSTGITGASSTFGFTPTDNGSYVVKLTVTDNSSATTTVEAAPIIVSNAGPVLGAVTVAQPVSGGPSVTVSGTITDAGIADTVTASIVWETGGTPQTVSVVGSNGSFTYSASHTYTTPGSKAIVVSALDDDGGPASGSAAAVVQAALSTTGTLAVLGTGGGDNVAITSSGGVIEVQGSVLGAPITFSAGSVSLLKIDLGNGDDSLLVGSSVTATLLAFAGSGNDIIVGGGGSNVLVGGAGIDLLTGRGARDILIGGAGADVLSGAGGQDILVDGETTNDGNETALLAILAEWNSGNDSLSSFQRRVRRLSGLEGGGLNGSYTIITLDNTSLDILLGGAGNDWLISHNGDISLG